MRENAATAQHPVQTRTRRSLGALAIALAAIGVAASARAQNAPAAAQAQAEAASISTSLAFSITLRPDRTAEKIETRRVKVLGAGAVQSVGQQTLSYVEGMQSVEILDAYTEKVDGRRIAVDPANIITRDAVTSSYFHLRDQKVRTVIYPDVAVGDTVVLTARRNITSGNFPGHYFDQFLFMRSFPYAESTITIAAPKNLPLNVAVLGEGLDHQSVDELDTIRHAITYRPSGRRQPENGATSAADRDPRVLISTFNNYEEQAQSYWEAASPRIESTPEISALAETITQGLTDRRQQAEAIDTWVKRNIRYVAIYLGTARVVPYSASSVLKNRYGDCKDHATLMSALLAAKGIASEHVLISSGSAYTLPEPATMMYLNHVILYLPEFGIYDDPTNSFAGFGVLSHGTYDKPVIHVSGNGVHRARTPAMQTDDHTSINRSRIAIATDGAVSGETELIGTGLFAMGLRTAAAGIQNTGIESSVEQRLRALGAPGKGRFEIGSLSELGQSYSIKSRFTLNERLQIAPSATAIIPFGLPIHRRPGEFLFNVRYPGRTLPFVCYAGRQIEELEVTFAEGLALPQPIKGRTVQNRLFSYSSDYQVENRTLKVKREFVSRVPGQVCPPEVEEEIADGLKAVRDSLGTRMRFPAASAQQSVPSQEEPRRTPDTESVATPSIPQPEVSATSEPQPN